MADIVLCRLDKITMCAIKLSPEDEESGAILKRRRGLDNVGFAFALQARPDEILAVKAIWQRSSSDGTVQLVGQHTLCPLELLE